MPSASQSDYARPSPPARTWILLLIVMVPQLGLTLVNPSNATIAADLGTTIPRVETTLTIYMAGYAVSMFLAGTLADRFDASRLQSIGLVLFAAGCLLAAVAPGIGLLGSGRFLQALGGTSATVLCRIIVQRRYPSDRRVDVLTSMSMVISLTPSLSPLAGGLLAEVLPWQVLFVMLAVFAIVLIPMIEMLLGSAEPADPGLPSLRQFAGAIAESLGSRRFRWYAAGISLTWMTYFGFVNSSSTILQDILGQAPVSYGVLMAIPALGYLAGSMLVKRSADVPRAVAWCVGVGAVGIAATVGTAMTALSDRPLAVVTVMSVTFVGVGATIPYAQAGLLDLDLRFPGVAAGLFFFLQMACGAMYGATVRALSLTTVPSFLLALIIPQIALTAMVAVDRWGSRR